MVDLNRNPIPCFVNPLAGRGAEVARAVGQDPRFRLVEIPPEELAEALRAEIDGGAKRLAVAGGDGTIATAAGVLAGTGVELALVPGGTLNHFAGSQGIGAAPREALEIAATGDCRLADVGFVNDRAFLNTSALGVYIAFVRNREEWRPRVGYLLASAWAAAWVLTRLPRYSLTLELNGQARRFRSSLVFVGVGERELKFPTLGERVAGGESGLHVLIVQEIARSRLFTLLLSASTRGVRAAADTPHLGSFLVDELTIDLRHGSARVALDGEVVDERMPLKYRLGRGVLKIVVPSAASREGEASESEGEETMEI